MEVREHTCLTCEHQWVSPVVFSQYTQNLSGERTEFCPKCNGRTVWSGPAKTVETGD
jgi:hypothetical protein